MSRDTALSAREVKRLQRIVDGKTIKQIANYHNDSVRDTLAIIKAINAKLRDSRENYEDGDRSRQTVINVNLAEVCDWDDQIARLAADYKRISGGVNE